MRTRLLVAGFPLAMLVACGGSDDEAVEPPPVSSEAGPQPQPEAGPVVEPTSDAGIDAEHPSFMVTGHLVGGYGQALAGLAVSVAGKPVGFTGPDGAFTASDVTTPYDVTIRGELNGRVLAHTFVGLTTPTPSITPYHAHSAQAYATIMHASVAGSIGTVPAGEAAKVCVEGLSVPVSSLCAVVQAGASTYSLPSLAWAVAPTAAIRLHVLRIAADGQNAITEYTAAGTADATVASGGSATVDVTLGAAPVKSTITIKGATAGETLPSARSFLTIGSMSFPLEARTTAAESFSFVVPVLPGATYWSLSLAADQSMAWTAGLAAGATGIMKFAAAPALLTPLEGATGVTSATPFELTNPSGLPLTLQCSSTTPDAPELAVTTVKTTFTLPDLSVFGLVIPAGALYYCQASIAGGGPATDGDALLIRGGPVGTVLRATRALSGESVGFGEPGASSAGTLRSITFQ